MQRAIRFAGGPANQPWSQPIASLFFDLDGTLTDPREGIVRCIQHALARLDQPIPPADKLVWCIGPPLQAAFSTLLKTEDVAEQQAAVEFYRERYRDIGIFENGVYPGIPEALAALSEQGHRLYVVSSKPGVFVERVIRHYDLDSHFLALHGSELSGERTQKAELITYVLDQHGIAAGDATMIGDRRHDIEGGLATGVRTLGVTWGYGGEAELREAGAADIIDAPGGSWRTGPARPTGADNQRTSP